MNVHHLELFYYVAKYGGITAAVRKMPYGIQQPAISGQILQLEKSLKVKLFNRRPFALTKAGHELYAFAEPFFSRLGDLAEGLRGGESQHLRVAASAAVLNGYLPGIFAGLRAEYPQLRLTLRDALPAEAEDLLCRQEVDIALGPLRSDVPPGLKVAELLKLPLVLVIPDGLKARSFDDLLAADGESVSHPRVGLPPDEVVAQIFQKELDRRGIRWEARVEVNSLELIRSYVEGGFGIGLSVAMPGSNRRGRGRGQGEAREIPLAGFPPLRIGLMFQGKLKPLAARFAAEVGRVAHEVGGAAR
ncbi:hypothetical protein BH23VER1_BH23VER1_10110 [soil metagenome]